jgi:hypothetical protein
MILKNQKSTSEAANSVFIRQRVAYWIDSLCYLMAEQLE